MLGGNRRRKVVGSTSVLEPVPESPRENAEFRRKAQEMRSTSTKQKNIFVENPRYLLVSLLNNSSGVAGWVERICGCNSHVLIIRRVRCLCGLRVTIWLLCKRIKSLLRLIKARNLLVNKVLRLVHKILWTGNSHRSSISLRICVGLLCDHNSCARPLLQLSDGLTACCRK